MSKINLTVVANGTIIGQHNLQTAKNQTLRIMAEPNAEYHFAHNSADMVQLPSRRVGDDLHLSFGSEREKTEVILEGVYYQPYDAAQPLGYINGKPIYLTADMSPLSQSSGFSAIENIGTTEKISTAEIAGSATTVSTEATTTTPSLLSDSSLKYLLYTFGAVAAGASVFLLANRGGSDGNSSDSQHSSPSSNQNNNNADGTNSESRPHFRSPLNNAENNTHSDAVPNKENSDNNSAGLSNPLPHSPTVPPISGGKQSGLNLDIARHFYTIEDIKGFIDTISRAGGTFLHLHFSDDQNYAFESDILGQTTKNAVRNADGTYTNPATGKQFLSKAQLAEIVNYAQSKSVELIPELDMPAHMGGVFSLLRHNSQYGQGFINTIKIPWTAANTHQIDVTKPEAVNLVKSLVNEVSGIFGQSSRHFHLGADEFEGGNQTNLQVVDFLNAMADMLVQKGLTARIYNDGIHKANFERLNHNIEVTYWGYEDNHLNSLRISMPELLNAGFKVLNYNNTYLYYIPEEKQFASEHQSDYEAQTMLREWSLGVWGSNKNVVVADTGNLIGAALSIWGEHAGALSGSSIQKYSETYLENMIKIVNGTPTNAFDANGNFILSHNSYLDMSRVSGGEVLDIGANGQQTLYLLQENSLVSRNPISVYVRGLNNDKIVLDAKWQASGETQVIAYGNDQVTYQAYKYLGHTLWVDKDLTSSTPIL